MLSRSTYSNQPTLNYGSNVYSFQTGSESFRSDQKNNGKSLCISCVTFDYHITKRIHWTGCNIQILHTNPNYVAKIVKFLCFCIRRISKCTISHIVAIDLLYRWIHNMIHLVQVIANVCDMSIIQFVWQFVLQVPLAIISNALFDLN